MVAWIAMEKLGPTKERKIRISGPTLIVRISTQLVSLSTLRFMLKRQGMWQVLKKDWAKKKKK